MFISNEEADKRLNSSENILRHVNEGVDIRAGVAHEVPMPVIVPDEILPPEDDQTCESAKAIGMEPAGRLLARMLARQQHLGRRQTEKNLDPVVRAAVATCAQMVDTKTAAQTFGTSHHHADELKHGYTHQAARYGRGDNPPQDPREDILGEVARQKKDIRNLAFEKLCKVLGLMTDDKIEAVTDVTKLARISRDLSAVHDKAMPKEERGDLGGVHFHVWKPEMREESSYEVVTVGAQQ